MSAKLGTVVNAAVRITQTFGNRPDYYRQYGFAGHEGLDLAANEGTIITAATNGSVDFAGDKGNNYGKHVEIWNQDQNIKTLYAHLKDLSVKTGDNVTEGQQIGHMGGTGKVTGVHLHFGVMRTKSGKADPFNPFSGTIQSNAPLNPDNGYKGWENPQDDNLFNWYRGYGIGEPGTSIGEPGTPEPGTTPPSGTTTDFDRIYQTYYAGWGRPEAEADFNQTMGGDEGRLKIARGISDVKKKKTTKKRPKALLKTYTLNPAYGGLSLNQLGAGGMELGRVDILAGFLGISPEQKLQPGQELSMLGFPTDAYPSSSEWLAVLKLSAKGGVGKPGDYYILPQYAGMNLNDIRNKTELPFRADILAGFLGISDRMPIPGNQGFGTQAFPGGMDSGSGEVQGFLKIFSKTPPAFVPSPEDIEPLPPELPKEPTLHVQTDPIRARFYIDGLYFRDLTPSNKPYPVIAGPHTVRVEKTGYKTEELIVNVGENEQKSVMINLEPEAEEIPTIPTPSTTGKLTLSKLNARLERIEKTLTEAGILK